jgi:Flp pilus assembly protein TadG
VAVKVAVTVKAAVKPAVRAAARAAAAVARSDNTRSICYDRKKEAADAASFFCAQLPHVAAFMNQPSR